MIDGYVYKQTAIDEINKALDRETLLNSFVRKIAVEAVKKLPTADVVEVVRCKDCIHFEEHKNYGNLGESAYTCAGNMDGWIYPDSYCSRGERRDG